MAIKPQFTKKELHDYVEKQKEKYFTTAIRMAFNQACLEVVADARMTDTYIDQSGRLRSSIGYVLYYNGELIDHNFKASPAEGGVAYMQYYNKKTEDGKKEKVGRVMETKGGDGNDGAEIGFEYAKSIAEQSTKSGFVAVIVAGADYATYVEAKGYDVLTGSTQRFAEKLNKYFKSINNKFGSRLTYG